MKNVVYEVDMDSRNERGEFKREIVKTLSNEQNPYLEVALFRMQNIGSECKYVLGHIK